MPLKACIRFPNRARNKDSRNLLIVGVTSVGERHEHEKSGVEADSTQHLMPWSSFSARCQKKDNLIGFKEYTWTEMIEFMIGDEAMQAVIVTTTTNACIRGP